MIIQLVDHQKISLQLLRAIEVIFQGKMPNITVFKPLKCENLLHLFV